ncbi:unnamed protein product, partial [Prorocentrum cordatum]
DKEWAVYVEEIVEGKLELVAKGPACKECQKLHAAFPLQGATFHNFVQMYKESALLKKRVEKARGVLQKGEDLEVAIPGAVNSSTTSGQTMEAVFLVFSTTEFLRHFQVEAADVGLKAAPVVNEENEQEDVILLRDDSAPRRLRVFTTTCTKHEQDMLGQVIRKDQDKDVHKWLLALDTGGRDRCLRPEGHMQVKTMSFVDRECKAVVAKRTADGVIDSVREHKGIGKAADGEEEAGG